jgi:hypothetical protein
MELRSMDDKDTEQKFNYIEFGDAGIGTIQAGSNQQEHMEEFTPRIASGEFHVQIQWDETRRSMILVRCVDGRIPITGANPLGPNSAGGTESLFVADDLTSKRFESDDGTTASGYRNALTFLVEAGYEVGGHTDDHAEGDASGCGANDKLGIIYAYIAKNSETLRSIAHQFGVSISDEDHHTIVRNATLRNSFSSGRELLTVLTLHADERFIDTLAGSHNEVVTILNTVPGTTLDRDALRREFGEEYEAFNVDVWAFEEAARAISLT